MFKFIKSFFNKSLIKFSIFFKNNKQIQFNPEELNFRVIDFIDQNKIKSAYWNFEEIKPNIKDDKSLIFHSFDWLNYSKKLGGANNIKTAKLLLLK